MSNWTQIYYKLLDLVLSILVKSKSIPENPALELRIDMSHPIIYVLPYNSKIDLLTLRAQCLVHNLPDPLDPLKMDGNFLPRYVFIHSGPGVFPFYSPKTESINLFYEYLDLHRTNPNLDAQIVLISVMFGRRPGKKNLPFRILNGIQKFFVVSWMGRDSFVRFSTSFSLRKIVDEHGNNNDISKKLVRIAHIHFMRLHRAAVGPLLYTRRDLFNKLLRSKAIARVIEDEARSKKISYKKAQQNAIALMEEIAANFSYEMIRISDRILSFVWNRIYQGINVYNAARIRQIAHNSHEIVYIPCHRSHMDYLLLSYVLYHQGLVPPHIAAGINLNFWPAGPIFRSLGAFFIRRTFKGNKLYSTVFREYLIELFNQGYSVEYFIEGGRSRTGRLLDPKTGTLSITIQALLRGRIRPITLVPIYIGYENVIEVNSYEKEMRGTIKKKESFLQVLRGLRKLRNLGHGYINFGEPMQLINWLNLHIPKWRESIDPTESVRPVWLTPTVNQIALEVMIRINNAVVANAMNLCCTALLASRHRSLTREQLTEQLECYLDIMRHAPYSIDSTVPNTTATRLIDHALKMDKFRIKKDVIDDIIILPREQAVLMTYYRNNISHMLILPSVMATIVIRYGRSTRQKLYQHIKVLYPLLKSELFLRWKKDELSKEIDKLTTELLRQDLWTIKNDEININTERSCTLQILADNARETLQRYAITFYLLTRNPSINRETLEKKSQKIAKQLSILHGINAPEFFDKTIFSSLTLTLRNEGYISDIAGDPTNLKKILQVYQMIRELITSDVRLMIESSCIVKENSVHNFTTFLSSDKSESR